MTHICDWIPSRKPASYAQEFNMHVFDPALHAILNNCPYTHVYCGLATGECLYDMTCCSNVDMHVRCMYHEC